MVSPFGEVAMTLLADAIRANTAKAISRGESSEIDFLARFDDAAFFEASEVADYFFEGNDREEWNDEMFPNVAPPFAECWIEYRSPERVISSVNGERQETPYAAEMRGRFGALISSRENVSRKTLGEMQQAIYRRGLQEGVRLFGVTDGNQAGSCAEIPKWIVTLALVFGAKAGGMVLLKEVFYVPLRDDGSIVPNGRWVMTPEMTERMKESGGFIMTAPFLLALQFINAVNIPREQGQISERLDRARIRKGKPPLVRYSVIRVPGYRSLAEPIADGERRQVGLHAVRGHFKRRTTGIFWWHPHLRGSYEQGVILSSYAVGSK
jgi:hypothetical protein